MKSVTTADKRPLPLGKVLCIVQAPRHGLDSPEVAILAIHDSHAQILVCSITLEIAVKLRTPDTVLSAALWCGREALAAVTSQGKLHVCTEEGCTDPFEFCGDLVHMRSEVDGTRVFTNRGCFFVGKVPKESGEDLHASGVVGDSARFILRLYQKYVVQDPTLEDTFRDPVKAPGSKISGSDARSGQITTRTEAMDGLAKLAASEFDLETQRFLLKAVEFSAVYTAPNTQQREDFQKILRYVRILNQLRCKSVLKPSGLSSSAED